MAINNDQCGCLIWFDYKTNCTAVYYVQVLAPITLLTWVHPDDYLDGEAGGNTNIALDKIAAAVIGGVVFITIFATLILRRWKQSAHPSLYDPVSSPELQMSYVDHIIPTSMAPEMISDLKVGEANSQEDELMGSVRRSCNSAVKRNPLRSTKRRPVATHPILLVKDTEDRSTEEEDDGAPQPPRVSRKVKRKSQRPSDRVPHDLDNSIAHNQDLGSASNSPASMGLSICTPGGHFIPNHASYCPICGRPFSRPSGSPDGSASASHNNLGSPMYMTNPLLVPHYNPYHPTHGHPYPLPMAPYGYNTGGPGTNVNSGVGNITHVTISGIGNNDSVDHSPYTRTERTQEKNNSEDCGACLR
ncbi:hypothetical protein BYT27DRAFT_7198314 [Phlegmacium glaucopus]|nr:hypothetical protein BYT27DRAFT_7198314 [Phlegmacium glaucopus]